MIEPFVRHTGRVAALPRANVDTDQIVPKQFLARVERTGFGPALFHDWRYRPDGTPDPAFELNRPAAQGASILVAGANFGCGSSREHAVWALAEYGFRAILAPSFADLFYANCCQNGVLPVRLPTGEIADLFRRCQAAAAEYVLSVDLEEQRVDDGRGFHARFPIERYRREMLLHGLDEIGRTLLVEARIAAYETSSPPGPLSAMPRGDGGSGVKVYTIVVLPGDGIGPEVIAEAERVLVAVGETFGVRLSFERFPIGAAGVAAAGDPFPRETRAAVSRADAVLLGAVGDPAVPLTPEAGLLALRTHLGVYANLRPVSLQPALADRSPLKADRLTGVDLLIVRELTGGLYYGKPRRRDDYGAVNTLAYSVPEIERVARVAFEGARRRRGMVTSVDKANVLEVSQLWRDTVTRIGHEYPDVRLEHLYVDHAAMRLVADPATFDVILTENMFGDILSDEAAVLAGSLGLLPSASLGVGPGLFEPVHGSAPAIAGQGLANPIGAIASAALLLRHGLGLARPAGAVERAITLALEQGARTRDIAAPGDRPIGTSEMGTWIAELILARAGVGAS